MEHMQFFTPPFVFGRKTNSIPTEKARPTWDTSSGRPILSNSPGTQRWELLSSFINSLPARDCSKTCRDDRR